MQGGITMMDGNKFREKRENIEKLYENVHSLIDQKNIDEANEILDKSQEMLNELNTEDLSEIQERAAFNLKIQVDHLAKSVEKIENKKKK